MLFNDKGQREFNALQSNGQPRKVAYIVDHNGDTVVCEVDGLSVHEYPLGEPFGSIVKGCCDEHRANLHTHDDYRSAA